MRTGKFTTYLELPDGQEIDIEVEWEGYYEREHVSGNAENDHPASGDMDIIGVEIVGDWPEGLSDAEFYNLTLAQEDRFLEKAWENYHYSGE